MSFLSPVGRSSLIHTPAPVATRVIRLPAVAAPPPRSGSAPEAYNAPASASPYDRAVWAVKHDRLDLLPACLARLSARQRLELLGCTLHTLADATPVLDLLEPLSLDNLGAVLVSAAVSGAQPLAVIERLVNSRPRPQLHADCFVGHMLHKYPAERQAALLDMLMPSGLNLNQPGLQGERPLHATVRVEPSSEEQGARCVAAVRNLAAHGADVNDGFAFIEVRRPLHIAVGRAAPWGTELARALLDAGAEVDARVVPARTAATATTPWPASMTTDDTPLMLACKSGCVATVELLLQHGADPSLADSQGDTALDYAARCPDPEIARTLRSYHTFRAANHRRAARLAWREKHYKTCWAVL